MGNNRIDAKRLLELSAGLGALTLVTTYLVSTTSGRVAPFIPIISEMPFAEPESAFTTEKLSLLSVHPRLIVSKKPIDSYWKGINTFTTDNSISAHISDRVWKVGLPHLAKSFFLGNML